MDLSTIRERLATVDAALVDALAARQELVREVARLKVEGGAALRDLPREEEVLTRVVERARAAGRSRASAASSLIPSP